MKTEHVFAYEQALTDNRSANVTSYAHSSHDRPVFFLNIYDP